MENNRNDSNGASQGNHNTEFTRSHSDREFHNPQESQDAAGFEETGRNESATEGMGGQPGNTSTGANYGHSERKESFTDENYGATARHSRDDIPETTTDNNPENYPSN